MTPCIWEKGDRKLGSVLVVYNRQNKNDEVPKKQMMGTFWVAVVFRNNGNYAFSLSVRYSMTKFRYNRLTHHDGIYHG